MDGDNRKLARFIPEHFNMVIERAMRDMVLIAPVFISRAAGPAFLD